MTTQTPRQIAFEDIRKGDRIACEHTNAGVTVRYGGVVGRRGARAWYTDAGGLVVASGEPGTITLLHRPAPAEPMGLGAVVRARVSRSPVDPRRARTLVCVGGVWVDEQDFRQSWTWSDLDPESIEVLSEGIGVDQ